MATADNPETTATPGNPETKPTPNNPDIMATPDNPDTIRRQTKHQKHNTTQYRKLKR
jgi:hypothetical protein